LPSQYLRSAAHISELPADASTGRRIAESILPMTGDIWQGAKSAWQASPNWFQGAGQVLGAAANRAAIMPATAYAGSLGGEKIGEAAGYPETGALLGGLLGGQAGGALERPAKYAWGQFQRATSAEEGENPLMPSAKNVGQAAAELSQNLKQYTGDTKGINPTYAMLANPEGMETQKTLAAFGSPPARVAEDYPNKFLPELADLAVTQRRELPNRSLPGDPNGDNVDVLRLAQSAAANRAGGPADIHDSGVIDAMQNWIKGNMGDQPVDMTGVRQTMVNRQSGTGHTTNITALQGKINALDELAPPDANGNSILDFPRARQWISDLGRQTQGKEGSRLGLLSDDYGATYGAAKQALSNAATARSQANPNVNPNAFNTAVEIEHRELAAQDLGQLMLKTLKSGKSTFAKGLGSVLGLMPNDDPHLYRRLTGGDYQSGGAPQALPGSGDVRRTLENTVTLGNSTALPANMSTSSPMAMWRTAREALQIPGIGSIIAMASGAPALPTAAAAVGGGYGLNWLRGGLQQDPVVRNIMMGRPVSPMPAPSTADVESGLLASNAALQNRGAIEQEGVVHENHVPPNWTPYTPQPGVVPKTWTPYTAPRSQLSPALQNMLASFNRANIGQPRGPLG
jgi:hypothetical protein